MRELLTFLLLAGSVMVIGPASAQRQTPYWASIAAGRAMMRVGPGQNYPATWLYIRPDLPIKVTAVLGDWRRIEDPDGTSGWMLVRLLSDQCSAMVRGASTQPMYDSPSDTGRVSYRAEPGVVGRVTQCNGGWCLLSVGGRSGHIRVDTLWGVDAAETID